MIRSFIKRLWRNKPFRTFIQALGGYIVANITAIDWSSDTTLLTKTLIGLLIAGVAAGFSAVMNIGKSDRAA